MAASRDIDFRAVIRQIEGGWDSAVYEIDETWIVRVPRRREVAERVRAETALLPELASRLPVAVPVFEAAVFDGPAFVAYRKLPGRPLASGIDNSTIGAAVGAFLSALHTFPVGRARELLLRSWDDDQRTTLAAFDARVLPLVSPASRAAAVALLAEARSMSFAPALVHCDLGPDHLLHEGDALTGVIDWSDACVGDPAIDFAWTLYATGASFSAALADAYGGIDAATRARGLVFHKLGPWHEVLYGLETDQREFVESGVAALEERVHIAEDRGD